MTMCEQGVSWIAQALIPSVPPTLTAIAGFYVFHKLAVRRQKREEIRQLCQKFRESLQDLSGAAEAAWGKAGDSAVKEGDIVKYKGKIFVADLYLSSIATYEPKFDSVKQQYIAYKRRIDEYSDEKERVSIESRERAPKPSYANVVRRMAGAVSNELDKAFKDIFP